MPPSIRPKGYVGIQHETLGSDILSVLRILRLPEQILGAEEAARLANVDPHRWYPIGWLLELMEHLDREVGSYGLMRMGRELFKLSHETRVLEVAQSARDIVFGIDGMYHHANRGRDIGGWKVLCFEPGRAELEKTTPHHCAMEQGLISAGLAAVGCPCNVEQLRCVRRGAPACVFEITCAFVDGHWSGSPNDNN
jgi:hypothetical protein